jgi:hypothetical protein
VSFTSGPLYSPEEESTVPNDRRLGGPQNWSGRHGKEKNLAPAGIRTTAPR